MKRSSKITICVFLKPPRPGLVKTRLIPAVGAERAAALAQSFFDDVWDSLKPLAWSRRVVASTEPVRFEDERQVWLQGTGDLGRRQENILRRALRHSRSAIIIGADLPGLPIRVLESARMALLSSDVVVGPSDDGGFYLIGVNHCPSGLLSGIRWSQSDTFLQTLSRICKMGLSVAVLEPWSDIDTPDQLLRLRSLLQNGAVKAPHTCAALSSWELSLSNHGNSARTANSYW